MAKITVNGESQEVNLPLTLTELIKQNNVEQPDMVSVQVNDDFVDRTEWDDIQIKEENFQKNRYSAIPGISCWRMSAWRVRKRL